jgi:hypothetical protein
MVRKLGELPKFLVFSSRTDSNGNNFVFTFSLLMFAFLWSSVLSLLGESIGGSNIFVAMFSDEPR